MSTTISAAEFQSLTSDFNALGGKLISKNENFSVGSTLYADLVNDLSVQTVVSISRFGVPIYGETAAPGVDPATYDWLNDAEYVNQDVGFFGQFIVEGTSKNRLI